MNKLLKIFCFCGLFCLCDCYKNSIHPNLINKKVCKQILVKNYFDDNEYIINNDISIQELYELLQNATLCDIIKLPPRLVLTIKGRNYHQTFFICDNYIKDDKRKIYRCKKNIEKELKKIIKEQQTICQKRVYYAQIFINLKKNFLSMIGLGCIQKCFLPLSNSAAALVAESSR